MLTRLALDLAERGVAPDWAIEMGIRRLLAARRASLGRAGDSPAAVTDALVRRMDASPVALATADANLQHYDVPARFFEIILGPHLKYSSALWPEGVTTLEDAEAAMLALTCERAGLANGQEVLELGCGWGSLTLWVAERYPASRVLAISNSRSQRRFIEARAAECGLDNVEVQTADMCTFDTARHFDRIVSVEMFEHMRNHRELFRRITRWLTPGGAMFMHVFCHRDTPYFYEADGDGDWMARHFFTGGLMPSASLVERVAGELRCEATWHVSGRHYARTLRAWLGRLDARRDEVAWLFREVYGAAEAERWVQRWRIFLLACAELFAYRGGDEWFVVHHRLVPEAPR